MPRPDRRQARVHEAVRGILGGGLDAVVQGDLGGGEQFGVGFLGELPAFKCAVQVHQVAMVVFLTLASGWTIL